MILNSQISHMTQPFDIAVLVGRFQPFHLAHAALLKRALEIAPRVVVVLGSAFHARTAKNPFTWGERAAMIRETLAPVDQARLEFAPVRDLYDDAKWCQAVRAAVDVHAQGARRYALVGCFKDASSYYLANFPNWELVDIEPIAKIEAQSVRARWFEADDAQRVLDSLASEIPGSVVRALKGFSETPEWAELREEHLAILHSRKTYGAGPFVTVDAVVTANDHVLLVRRGHAPGKGLWALPGGFLEPSETLLAGALRELQEETGLALATSAPHVTREPHANPELARCSEVAVFSHPARSLRGRIITHAHYFELGALPMLPAVAGADDAAAAQWIDIQTLRGLEEQFFDDHFHVLRHFLRIH